MIRVAIAIALVLTLVGAVVQLTCIASERVATTTGTAPDVLFVDGFEDLPTAIEIDDAAGAAGPALTY